MYEILVSMADYLETNLLFPKRFLIVVKNLEGQSNIKSIDEYLRGEVKNYVDN